MGAVAGLLTWGEHLIESAGWPWLTAVMAAEAVLPLPSGVVLPAIGTRVSSGELALLVAVLATTVGSVLGSALVYSVARWGGRDRIARLTTLVGGSDERWSWAEGWFVRHGALVVLGRLIPGVRPVISLPAGSLRMPLPRLLVLTGVGSAVWNGAWIGAGAWLTTHWSTAIATSAALLSSARPVLLTAAVVGCAWTLAGQTRMAVVVPRAVPW